MGAIDLMSRRFCLRMATVVVSAILVLTACKEDREKEIQRLFELAEIIIGEDRSRATPMLRMKGTVEYAVFGVLGAELETELARIVEEIRSDTRVSFVRATGEQHQSSSDISNAIADKVSELDVEGAPVFLIVISDTQQLTEYANVLKLLSFQNIAEQSFGSSSARHGCASWVGDKRMGLEGDREMRALLAAVTFLNLNAPNLSKTECLHRAIVGAVVPKQTKAAWEGSIFGKAGYDRNRSGLSDLDRRILRLAYDPDIPDGMPWRELIEHTKFRRFFRETGN
jgi:hypothetical protein